MSATSEYLRLPHHRQLKIVQRIGLLTQQETEQLPALDLGVALFQAASNAGKMQELEKEINIECYDYDRAIRT